MFCSRRGSSLIRETENRPHELDVTQGTLVYANSGLSKTSSAFKHLDENESGVPRILTAASIHPERNEKNRLLAPKNEPTVTQSIPRGRHATRGRREDYVSPTFLVRPGFLRSLS